MLYLNLKNKWKSFKNTWQVSKHMKNFLKNYPVLLTSHLSTCIQSLSVSYSSSCFSGLYLPLVVSTYIFLELFFFSGFGGSFMAPSPSPVTPAQNNLLQPNFEAAFGTMPSTSSSSSFDPSGEVVIFKCSFHLFWLCNSPPKVSMISGNLQADIEWWPGFKTLISLLFCILSKYFQCILEDIKMTCNPFLCFCFNF